MVFVVEAKTLVVVETARVEILASSRLVRMVCRVRVEVFCRVRQVVGSCSSWQITAVFRCMEIPAVIWIDSVFRNYSSVFRMLVVTSSFIIVIEVISFGALMSLPLNSCINRGTSRAGIRRRRVSTVAQVRRGLVPFVVRSRCFSIFGCPLVCMNLVLGAVLRMMLAKDLLNLPVL